MYLGLWFPGRVVCFQVENETEHAVASIPPGGKQSSTQVKSCLLGRRADPL